MPDRITTPLRPALAALTAAALGCGLAAAPSAEAATGPAPLTVSSGALQGPGDLFLTPTDDTAQTQSAYDNGAEILSRTGQTLWFHAAPAGDSDSDLRVQRLDGHRVLTFWEGSNLGGLSNGTDYVYDTDYRQIAAVHAGDGDTTDGHEFLLTPWGTAFVLSYDTATANLTSIGGPADQTVIDGIVQEVDVHTGRVLWSWNSADHVPYSESEQPLPAAASDPWDWFHVNAVKLGPGHSVIVDARDTWTAYDVAVPSGRIRWQLGGRASSFTLRAAPGQTLNQAGDIFAWQHDPQPIGHHEYTFFDNESAGAGNTGVGASSEFPESRVVTVRLDHRAGTATLIAADDQPHGELASSQGNGQRLADGGELIGWGILPEVSEFDPAGQLVFDADFPAGVNTYRAYLQRWPGPTGR